MTTVNHTYDEADVTRLRIALNRIARRVDRQVSNDGMSRTQLSVLATVATRKQLGMSELADVEGINPTMLSRIVGKLEAAGLVVRASSTDDRRVIQVEITPVGARLHARLRRQRTKLLAERLVDLPTPHAETLLAALPALESLADALTPQLMVSSQ